MPTGSCRTADTTDAAAVSGSQSTWASRVRASAVSALRQSIRASPDVIASPSFARVVHGTSTVVVGPKRADQEGELLSDVDLDRELLGNTSCTVDSCMTVVRRITARGDAHRNPSDSNQPLVGEEIAAARTLIDLGTQLLQAADSQIEQVTNQPAHLVR